MSESGPPDGIDPPLEGKIFHGPPPPDSDGWSNPWATPEDDAPPEDVEPEPPSQRQGPKIVELLRRWFGRRNKNITPHEPQEPEVPPPPPELPDLPFDFDPPSQGDENASLPDPNVDREKAREMERLEKKHSKPDLQILPHDEWALHHPNGSDARDAAIDGVLNGSVTPDDAIPDITPDALLYRADDIDERGFDAVDHQVMDAVKGIEEYDFERFAKFLEEMRGKMSREEAERIYGAIANDRARHAMLEDYDAQNRQRILNQTEQTAQHINDALPQLEGMDEIIAAAKGNYYQESDLVNPSAPRVDYEDVLSDKGLPYYQQIRDDYGEYINTGDEEAYQRLLDAIGGYYNDQQQGNFDAPGPSQGSAGGKGDGGEPGGNGEESDQSGEDSADKGGGQPGGGARSEGAENSGTGESSDGASSQQNLENQLAGGPDQQQDPGAGDSAQQLQAGQGQPGSGQPGGQPDGLGAGDAGAGDTVQASAAAGQPGGGEPVGGQPDGLGAGDAGAGEASAEQLAAASVLDQNFLPSAVATDADKRQGEANIEFAQQAVQEAQQQQQQRTHQLADANSFEELKELQEGIAGDDKLFGDMKEQLSERAKAKEEHMKTQLQEQIDKMAEDGFLSEEKAERAKQMLAEGNLDTLDELVSTIEREAELYERYRAIEIEVEDLVQWAYDLLVERLPRQEVIEVDEDALMREGELDTDAVTNVSRYLAGEVFHPLAARHEVQPKLLIKKIFDTSGSTKGETIEMERKLAVAYIMLFGRLEKDYGYIRTSIDLFSNKIKSMKRFEHSMNSRQSIKWDDEEESTLKVHIMQGLNAKGGTDMYSALRSSANEIHDEILSSPEYSALVLFFGDGHDTYGNKDNIAEYMRLTESDDPQVGFGPHLFHAIIKGDESLRAEIAEMFRDTKTGEDRTTLGSSFEEVFMQSVEQVAEAVDLLPGSD